jgi:hypothetical protein
MFTVGVNMLWLLAVPKTPLKSLKGGITAPPPYDMVLTTKMYKDWLSSMYILLLAVAVRSKVVVRHYFYAMLFFRMFTNILSHVDNFVLLMNSKKHTAID